MILVCASRMRLLAAVVSLGLSGVYGAAQTVKAVDYTHNVDPFIGVDWGGNTFVESAVPFGLVKIGPDMETFDGKASGFGYSSHGVIVGFSHLHLSGGAGEVWKHPCSSGDGVRWILGDIKTPRTDEVAKVGYYSAKLTRYGVKAEITSSRRVGVHRYTFFRRASKRM